MTDYKSLSGRKLTVNFDRGDDVVDIALDYDQNKKQGGAMLLHTDVGVQVALDILRALGRYDLLAEDEPIKVGDYVRRTATWMKIVRAPELANVVMRVLAITDGGLLSVALEDGGRSSIASAAVEKVTVNVVKKVTTTETWKVVE